MPIEVDAEQRLEQIAEATMRVAENAGPSAITIRAVAAELGGSTTVVTNYVKSREELLLNLVASSQRAWAHELNAVADAAGPDPRARLDETIRWSTSTVGHDVAARQIWLDVVSRAADGGAATLLKEDAVDHHERIRALVDQLVRHQPAEVADALYLAVRGFYFAATEDPERWTSDRAARALLALVEMAVD